MSEKLDEKALAEMKRLRRRGRASVRAGEMARRLHTDSVKALGAMLRVERRYRRWVDRAVAA
jgi:hypothetical protein